MRILIVRKEDGAILLRYDADGPSQSNYGGPWGNSDYCQHITLPEGLDEDCVDVVFQEAVVGVEAQEAQGVEGEEGYIAAIEAVEAREAGYVVIENAQKVTDKVDAQFQAAWNSLRSERNIKLSSCDWTQLTDSPLSSEKKVEWANYRQALRNMPQENEDPTNPEWPAEPL